jgi:hypothetical protein
MGMAGLSSEVRHGQGYGHDSPEDALLVIGGAKI